MPRFWSRYPDGSAGFGLVLLRLACGWVGFLVTARLPLLPEAGTAAAVLPAAIGIALTLGFVTRVAAFVLAAGALAAALAPGIESAVTMLSGACGCAALGLLGPGAYSIDAHVFGRRVIRLEPRGPERRGDG